jgi:hypothetical protein
VESCNGGRDLQYATQKTWEVVKRPMGENAVRNKWVFAIKRSQSGKVVKYKVRLIAQGFCQVAGVDYSETFNPVIQKKTLRVLMAVAVENGWELELDEAAAYLNSTLEVIIYIEHR